MKLDSAQALGISVPMQRWHRQAGFSLLEILVTLAIIFSLSAVGTVAFVSFIPKIRLSSVTNELSVAMQRARLLAIRESRQIKIHFESASGDATRSGFFETCYIDALGECVDQSGAPLAGGVGINLVHLPQDSKIFLLENTFDADEVIFKHDGTVDSTGHIRMGIWEDVAKTRLRFSAQVEIAKLDASRVEVTPPEANPMNPNF